MAQEIEIEYNALLTEAQYELLNKTFPFGEQAQTQINHYFETKDFRLKEQMSALRIRQKGDTYTLTLKEPYEDAILETHDSLTEAEFTSWIKGKAVHKHHVNKQLGKLNISESDLIYYGSLTTDRKSFTKNNIIYVLDKSFYNGNVDYELEIEAPSHEQGQTVISSLMKTFQIEKLNDIPKIKRFFQTLKSID